MADLKKRDLAMIERVRRTNGGGYPSDLMPKAQLNRLLKLGAVRFKPISSASGFLAPDHVQASRSAQSGYVIHGQNADAMLAARKQEQQ